MEDGKCAHPGCDCRVALGEIYCSEYCRQHGSHETGECECGHPDCE